MSHPIYLNGRPIIGHIKRLCPTCGDELAVGVKCPTCNRSGVMVDMTDYETDEILSQAAERDLGR